MLPVMFAGPCGTSISKTETDEETGDELERTIPYYTTARDVSLKLAPLRRSIGYWDNLSLRR